MATTFSIGSPTDIEDYGMRGTATRPSDIVHHHSRRINGKPFDFARIQWSDGSVSVKAWAGGTTDLLHSLHS